MRIYFTDQGSAESCFGPVPEGWKGVRRSCELGYVIAMGKLGELADELTRHNEVMKALEAQKASLGYV